MLFTRVIKSTSVLLISLICSLSAVAAPDAAISASASTSDSLLQDKATGTLQNKADSASQIKVTGTALKVAAQRELLMRRLAQLEADNDRLRQQLSQVQSSDESVRSLEQVLAQHSDLIEKLRRTQINSGAAAQAQIVSVSAATPVREYAIPAQPNNDSAAHQNGFQVERYQAPAAGQSQILSSASARSELDSQFAPTGINPVNTLAEQSSAAFWSLELAGASGVLALIGALVLLFVVTVLRKSYWMPRQCLVKRPAARVSEKGLAADLAEGYSRVANTNTKANTSQPARNQASSAQIEQEPALSDQEQARRDQQSMARMLEQGLALSDDDQALMTDSSSNSCASNTGTSNTSASNTGANSQPKTAQEHSARKKVSRVTSKQPKNPLADEYDLLGSSGFDGGFSESDEFDELFEQAAQVPEGKEVSEVSKAKGKTSCRRSDEDVLRSIREKTFDYVAPDLDDGAYLVEEGCDDLDKYMEIAFIEPPAVELDEARERRGRSL
ncbi:MAG: hypothetical protein ACRBBW_18600 [Cellvibrionaceae bacterium]